MHKIGDVKYIKKFAFIPKIIDNKIVWLKPYTVKLVYKQSNFIKNTYVLVWRKECETL